MGWVPQKSAGFGATAPAQKQPRSRCGKKKNIPFGTIFIEFGDTKKCSTFSGLELAPKSKKKLIGTTPFLASGKAKNWVFSLRIAHIALFYTINFFF